jgi:hypothetical protein
VLVIGEPGIGKCTLCYARTWYSMLVPVMFAMPGHSVSNRCIKENMILISVVPVYDSCVRPCVFASTCWYRMPARAAVLVAFGRWLYNLGRIMIVR